METWWEYKVTAEKPMNGLWAGESVYITVTQTHKTETQARVQQAQGPKLPRAGLKGK
jgi:hypothetical protein